ncbi:MAG: Leucyl/phenylalanyl-tRNA--protein transferase [Cyanobacteriota bacterium]
MVDVDYIISQYAQGLFLMADDDDQLGWYQSDHHALIPLDQRFRYPKSLQRVLNQNRFTVAINRDFTAVCQGCANRQQTWISDTLITVYHHLHQAGWAHSFETWEGDRLAGGILAIAIRGALIGESMFYNVPEGSKVAMVKLVEHLRRQGYCLFDAQLQNPHLKRFGAYEVSEIVFKAELQKALRSACHFLPN